MKVITEERRIVIRNGASQVYIEPWGENSVRVRMTAEAQMDDHDWALCEKVKEITPVITQTTVDMTDPWYRGEEWKKYHYTGTEYTMVIGKLTVKVNAEGWISFYNQKGDLLTQEYWRNRDRICRYAVPIRIPARELKPITGTSDYELTARFEAFDDEKIFGMGQYQEKHMDKKGAVLELAHRNSQASVPFYVSSRGYGFFWNNPAIGTATFGMNKTEWYAKSTKKMDYFLTAGDTPAEILMQYTAATGRSPMMPEFGLGYWQCKLRYRNQQEILEVAREHKRRGLPMDAIVVDFFHWTMQGEFKFEPRDWPDPDAMVKELKELGIETVVSVWPTIDERSENYGEMAENGYLVQTDRGNHNHMTWMGNIVFYDPTNPGAREFVWKKCKENYYKKGIRIFWLDEAEPEVSTYEYECYRYAAGPVEEIGNIYPREYSRMFYEGQKESGQEDIVNLVRCAWLGSQKYGALVWSGDIFSTYEDFRKQICAGLHMGLCGIPWWTTDIGGFHGGVTEDPDFQELLVRWFQFGTFCPVMRIHGNRGPREEIINKAGEVREGTGADNEVWSFGEKNYEILTKFIGVREKMRDYTRSLMAEAHEKGTPVMRTMFYEFPEDAACWDISDAYMFGSDILVAPIVRAKATSRTVYLPAGASWTLANTGDVYEGGKAYEIEAPIETLPIFLRDGKQGYLVGEI